MNLEVAIATSELSLIQCKYSDASRSLSAASKLLEFLTHPTTQTLAGNEVIQIAQVPSTPREQQLISASAKVKVAPRQMERVVCPKLRSLSAKLHSMLLWANFKTSSTIDDNLLQVVLESQPFALDKPTVQYYLTRTKLAAKPSAMLAGWALVWFPIAAEMLVMLLCFVFLLGSDLITSFILNNGLCRCLATNECSEDCYS